MREPRRHVDVRVARDSGRRRASGRAVIPVDQIRQPGRAAGWGDNGVKLVLVHRRIDPVGARQLQIAGELVEIFLLRERALRLRLDHDLLPEPRHLLIFVLLIEVDDVLHSSDWRLWTQRSQIGIEVRLELIEQDIELIVAKLGGGFNVGGIHDHSAVRFHHGNRIFSELVGDRAATEETASEADSGAAQTVGIQIGRVIGRATSTTCRCRWISRVDTSQHVEHDRCVFNRSRHRASGVLTVRDRDDPGPAYQSNGRLDSDDAVGGRGTNDRSIGLGSNRGRAKVSGHPSTRARAGPAGIPIEHVGIPRQTSPSAPSARGVCRAEVRPLAEIGFPEENRARRSQLSCDKRVL